MKIETQQDHLETLIVTLQELETLIHRGFNFDHKTKQKWNGIKYVVDCINKGAT